MSAVLIPMIPSRADPESSLLWLVTLIVLGAGAYTGATFLLSRSPYERARRSLREGILAIPGDSAPDLGLARPFP